MGKILDGVREALKYARGNLAGSRTTIYIVNGKNVSSEEWDSCYAPDMRKINRAFDDVSEAMDNIFKKATKP